MYRFLTSRSLLALSCLLYLALSVWTAVSPDMRAMSGDAGLCFPSPGQWTLSSLASWGLGVLLTALLALLLSAMTSRLSPGAGLTSLSVSVMLVALGVNPWVCGRMDSSILVAVVTLVCLHLMLGLYGQKNAAQGLFIIFSLLGWGALFQYAFLLIMPLMALCAYFVGVLRWRSGAAALLGAVAPFWIVFGLGLAPLSELAWPQLAHLLKAFSSPASLFLMLLTQGVTVLIYVLVALANAMRQDPQAQQQRANHACISLVGAAMVWYMIFDASNMLAYAATLCACLGLQTARHFRMTRPKTAAAATTAIILLLLLSLPIVDSVI